MLSKKGKVILSILVFVVLFLFVFYAAGKIAYDVYLSAGVRLEEKGDVIGAIRYLEKAARSALSQSSLYARIGDVGIREYDAILVNHKESKLGKEGSLEISVKNFMKSLHYNSRNPWAWSGLAENFERKSYLAAKSDVINISKLSYGNLGKLDYEDWMAIAAIKKAIEIEPNNYFYSDLLGFILMENNISDSALKYYERAIELFPVPDKHFFIPDKEISKAMLDAIETGLKKALISNELVGKARIYNALGQLLFEQRKLDSASDYFKKAMEEGYDKYVVLGRLGIISYLQQNYDKSLDYLIESIKGDHNKSYEIFLIGDIFCKKGDHERALNYFKQAKSNAYETGSKQEYLFAIAREYEHLKDFAHAESSYLEAIKTASNRKAYKRIVEFYQSTFNFEKAEKYIPLAFPQK